MFTPQKQLIKSFEKNLNNYALWVEGKFFTYKELLNFAIKIILLMRKKKSKIIAVLNNKDIYCYSSILSIFLDNKIYVPLNSKFSDKKNLDILSISNADTILSCDELLSKAIMFKKKLKKKRKYYYC